jgi:hypothetical protein
VTAGPRLHWRQDLTCAHQCDLSPHQLATFNFSNLYSNSVISLRHLYLCNRLLSLYPTVLILPCRKLLAKRYVGRKFHIEMEEAVDTPTLNTFKDEIQDMILQQGFTNDEVVAALARRGFQTSTKSLKRRLAAWGTRRDQGVAGVQTEVSDALAEAINHLFHHTQLTDALIAERIITDYNLYTTARQVRSIRSIFGWRRRHRPGTQSDAVQTASIYNHVQALLNGPGRTFGREWFISYLRSQFGYRARRFDVANTQKALNPVGVASRLPGLRKQRQENYITFGPNFLWCSDGHDKLSQYGIQIYTAVDAYSRKIIWFYCGNSNKTAINVIRQYLNTVDTLGLCPQFIRTDRGTATVLLVDLHFSLYIEAALREN